MAVAQQGYAFGQVRTRINRDPVSGTISVVYVVEQGPRVYIERINVSGNYRTEDYVIRREFRIAEGDAYNKVMVDQARCASWLLASSRTSRSIKSLAPPATALSSTSRHGTIDRRTLLLGRLLLRRRRHRRNSYSERNFMGTGQFVQVKLSGSQVSYGVDTSWTEPRFLDRNLSLGVDAFVRNSDYKAATGYTMPVTKTSRLAAASASASGFWTMCG